MRPTPISDANAEGDDPVVVPVKIARELERQLGDALERAGHLRVCADALAEALELCADCCDLKQCENRDVMKRYRAYVEASQ